VSSSRRPCRVLEHGHFGMMLQDNSTAIRPARTAKCSFPLFFNNASKKFLPFEEHVLVAVVLS
jgi:hypothetical protein